MLQSLRGCLLQNSSLIKQRVVFREDQGIDALQELGMQLVHFRLKSMTNDQFGPLGIITN